VPPSSATGSIDPVAARRPPRPGSSITWRIIFASAAVVVAVLVVALALTTISAQRTADAAVGRGLEQTRRHITALLAGREGALESGALVFAQNPLFVSLVMEKQPQDLLDQAAEAVERTGASWVQITDDLGFRLAKSDEPTAPIEPLTGSALIRSALAGDVAAGVGVSGDSGLFQTVAVPIAGGARVAGVLMAAQVVDSALATAVRQATGSEVVFYVVDTTGAPRIAASTVSRDAALGGFLARYVTADTTRSASGIQDTTSLGGAEVTLGGRHYVGQGQPLRSAGGDVLGGFVALRSRDAEMAPFHTLRWRILLAGVAGLLLAVGLSVMMARRITRPVLSLVEVTRRVAEGDYSAPVDVQGSDEIATLAAAVRTMVTDLRDKQALVDVLGASAATSRLHVEEPPRTRGHITSSSAVATEGSVFAGRYAIGDVLGEGGMGVVYKALDQELGEPIAVKILRPEALSADPAALERLKSEIRLARRISHRNVVRTHDFGEVDGIYFITMEYVAGTSLEALIEKHGRLPVPATLAIAKQLCRALEVAHEQGIMHRDIKPQNVMVAADGLVKVMDFGVARLVRRTSGVTRVGMVVGTPEYMAPEQLLSEDIDARADIYAAGIVLYECLTGRRPFEADSPVVLVGKLLSEPPVPPHQLIAEIPLPLSALVLRTLAADAAGRPQTATELHELLDEVGRG
jgi:serine/threonine-protein kinase